MSDALELLERIEGAAWELGNHQDDLPDDVFRYFEDEYTTIENMVAKAREAESE